MLKSSFSAEAARSVRNPNTFGKAFDRQHGRHQRRHVSELSKLGWQIASNRRPKAGVLECDRPVNLVNQPGDNLTTTLVRTLSINPNAAALDGDQTQILTVNYNLTASSKPRSPRC